LLSVNTIPAMRLSRTPVQVNTVVGSRKIRYPSTDTGILFNEPTMLNVLPEVELTHQNDAALMSVPRTPLKIKVTIKLVGASASAANADGRRYRMGADSGGDALPAANVACPGAGCRSLRYRVVSSPLIPASGIIQKSDSIALANVRADDEYLGGTCVRSVAKYAMLAKRFTKAQM
jgi:hypothetical protein